MNKKKEKNRYDVRSGQIRKKESGGERRPPRRGGLSIIGKGEKEGDKRGRLVFSWDAKAVIQKQTHCVA